MRILHLIQRYWPAMGGAERHLHEINTRLVADGHQVTVYTTDADDFQLFWDRDKRRLHTLSDTYDGVTIRRFRLRHLPGPSIVFPIIRRLMTHLSDLPIDTTPLLRIIGQWTPWAPDLRQALQAAGPDWDVAAGMTVTYDALLWPGAVWAARWGRPWLFYPLTHLGEGPRSAMRRYYTMRHQLDLSRRARWVFAQTATERDYLIERGVAPERVIIAGVGINLAEYGRGQAMRARARLGLAVDAPLVLSLGTASRDKGTTDTLAAIRRLGATGQPVHLAVAGHVQDDFRHAYDRLPPGVQRQVHLLGQVSEANKQDLLAAADVLCMPSRADSFGITYLEAWAYGKPVIGARVGGIQDIIAHEEDGLLVPFGQPGAVADALTWLLADPGRRAALGEAGRRKVLRQYTWDQVYARVRPAYAALASG